MSTTKIPYIALALLFVLTFTACKKERSPRLIVSVISQGNPVAGATVRAWPGPDPQVLSGMITSVVDSLSYDQTGTTDASGEVIFDFENSAVLDVDVNLIDAMGDTLLSGSKVVKIESVRQRDETNDFKEVIEIR